MSRGVEVYMDDIQLSLEPEIRKSVENFYLKEDTMDSLKCG